jgi:hypothetical protein
MINAIKQQLEYTIEENRSKKSDKQLIHDWLTDVMFRINKIDSVLNKKIFVRIVETLKYLKKVIGVTSV